MTFCLVLIQFTIQTGHQKSFKCLMMGKTAAINCSQAIGKPRKQHPNWYARGLSARMC